MKNTIVHLLRHGNTQNPDKITYGRLPNFDLSEKGRAEAENVAQALGDRDIITMVSSPMERAQQTGTPLARATQNVLRTDERLIESLNLFEGYAFSDPASLLRRPQARTRVWNPYKPSWGEPYRQIVDRMLETIATARWSASGHEAVLVSHQLPITLIRRFLEGRPLVHDPASRQCATASVTSLQFEGKRLVGIDYSEPGQERVSPDEVRKVAQANTKPWKGTLDLLQQPEDERNPS